ncbi:hypothetical protein [Streptomyces gardneri]|uniref:hypothetical protein n=1 Tax=Streptomyces gardneri TaxID=66892 RepID=UPI0035DF84C6
MRLFTRKPKPAPIAVTPEDAIVGMATLIADHAAGDHLAVEMLGPLGELPFTVEDWAAYPTDPERLARIAYFGGSSPFDLPDEARP